MVIIRRLEKSALFQRGCASIASELRGHQHGERDALMLDRVEGGLDIELRMQHHGAAGTQRRRGLVVEPTDVEQRQCREDVVVFGEIVHRRAVQRVPGDGILREHDALGPAGGARGVADEQRGAGIGVTFVRLARARGRRGGRLAAARQERGAIGPARRALAPGDRRIAAHRRAQHLGVLDELRLDEQQRWRAIGENLPVLGRSQPPVQRQEHRAQPRAGEQQRDLFGTVQAQVRDAVAAPDASGSQRCRIAVDQLRECRVAEVAAGKADRQPPGAAPGVMVDPGVHLHRRAPPPLRCAASARRPRPRAPPPSRYRRRHSR
ncbi:MAG: hypothetical protein M5U30_05605 [Burkholderiaceae bacterium]|nr:hypothetical protein [Burkholderiaceae bacterium]